MAKRGDFEWTPDKINRLRELVEEGRSGTEIAMTLSREYRHRITRNSVIGARNRNGIAIPGREKKPADPKPRTPPAPKRSRHTKKRAAGAVVDPKVAARRREEQRAKRAAAKAERERQLKLANRGRVSIVDLEKGECRYPTKTIGRDHLFCGKAAVAGKPYCAAHLSTCIVSGKGRGTAFDTPPPPGCNDRAWELAMAAYGTGSTATEAAKIVVVSGYPMTAYLLARRVAEYRDKITSGH